MNPSGRNGTYRVETGKGDRKSNTVEPPLETEDGQDRTGSGPVVLGPTQTGVLWGNPILSNTKHSDVESLRPVVSRTKLKKVK